MVPGLISDFSIFVPRTDLEPQAHLSHLSHLALSSLTHYN